VTRPRALRNAVRALAALVILPLGSSALVACSHGSANLTGHWRGLRAEGVSSDLLDATNSYANHMRLDVSGNAITVTTSKETRTDHYTVVSEDKTRTVITTDLDGASDPQTFTFSDPTTMRWAVAPGGAMVVFVKE
jgi:pyridoxine 5'-phosphate synthase PdxJ